MAFSSSSFAVFLALVLASYWFLDRRRGIQNAVILTANYVFYASWSLKYVGFLFGLSLASYLGALWIERVSDPRRRRQVLVVVILALASSLVVLKYLGLLTRTALAGANLFGLSLSLPTVQFLLPIGISYYTLIVIAYVTDVYRGKVAAERNWLTYFAYVGFFPHLLSGPISRSSVLAQFATARTWSWARLESGGAQVIWGLFKKVAIADTLAPQVNYIFFHHETLSGSVLFVGVVLYSFQVYADFSGYSDMARGIGQLLGIDLPQNFRLPFLSRDVGEFWRRWHTSLSAWLKDYVYVPLGGRSPVKWLYLRNLLLTFTLSGLWHGPQWTFVLWGLLNGVYFIPYVLADRLKKHRSVVAEGRALPGLADLAGILTTFVLVAVSRVLFRSPDMPSALGYFDRLFSASLFTLPDFGLESLWIVAGLMAVEWVQRDREHVLSLENRHLVWRVAVAAGVVALIAVSGNAGHPTEYVYFRF
jgi:D-alanyl-lipoteichoic acid acyltransferase DltB (MBOAT superfamily)